MKTCASCEGKFDRLIKGECKTCYERGRYHNRLERKENADRKRALKEALDLVFLKCRGRKITYEDYAFGCLRVVYSLNLLFEVSEEDLPKKTGGK